MSTQQHDAGVAAQHTGPTTEQRAFAASRFRIACLAAGVVGIGVQASAFRWGYPGIALFSLAATLIIGGLVALTAWTRRPIAVLPGPRGFAIDLAMLTVCAYAMSVLLGLALFEAIAFLRWVPHG